MSNPGEIRRASSSVLLDLDPPLESYSDFETENLSTTHVARKLSEVRRHRQSRPTKAARALVEVLGFVRSKQVHGYKRVFEHRDHTILQAAGAIACGLADASLELLESQLRPRPTTGTATGPSASQ